MDRRGTCTTRWVRRLPICHVVIEDRFKAKAKVCHPPGRSPHATKPAVLTQERTSCRKHPRSREASLDKCKESQVRGAGTERCRRGAAGDGRALTPRSTSRERARPDSTPPTADPRTQANKMAPSSPLPVGGKNTRGKRERRRRSVGRAPEEESLSREEDIRGTHAVL